MTTTETDIQKLRDEGRNFKLIEGAFGDRYVDTETSQVYVTQEQKTEGRRRQSEWARSQGFSSPPAQNQSQENNQRTIDSEEQAASASREGDLLSQVSNLTKEEKTFRQLSPQTTPPIPSKPPGFGAIRPSITDSLLSQGKKDLIDNYPQEAAQRNSGFFNTEITEPVPAYNSTNAEKVVKGKTTTY